jgi:hypothetical protein
MHIHSFYASLADWAAQSSQPILLLGGPLVGKSILLKRIEQRLAANKIKTFQFSAEKGATADELCDLMGQWERQHNNEDREVILIDDLDLIWNKKLYDVLSGYDNTHFSGERIIATSKTPHFPAIVTNREDRLLKSIQRGRLYSGREVTDEGLDYELFYSSSSASNWIFTAVWLFPWESLSDESLRGALQARKSAYGLEEHVELLRRVTGGHPALLAQAIGHLDRLLISGSYASDQRALQDDLIKVIANNEGWVVDKGLQWVEAFVERSAFWGFLERSAKIAESGRWEEGIDISPVFSDWFYRAGLIRPLAGGARSSFGRDAWQLSCPLVALQAAGWLDYLNRGGHGHGQGLEGDSRSSGSLAIKLISLDNGNSGALGWQEYGVEKRIELAPTEWCVIQVFSANRGKPLTPENILDALQRNNIQQCNAFTALTASAIRSSIRRLMHRLENAGLGWVLVNVPRRGYRFQTALD